eukprot:Gb_21996 [translate_table: standard]
MALSAVGRALSVHTYSSSKSYIADPLPSLHFSPVSSSSSCYQSPSVPCISLRLRVSGKDPLRQIQPSTHTCLPIREFGKFSWSRIASEEKQGGVIQSSLNPLRALSGSSEEASRVHKSALGHSARLVAQRTESYVIEELGRPLAEYMRLPASQYSVLDAERIERVDENTFRCYVYRFKFFSFEVCPVLLVRVEEQSNGCRIQLLSCKLEGSPVVVAQNEKFSASMVNEISCSTDDSSSTQKLISNTTIEVVIDIPFPFRTIPVELIESTGNQVLQQLLRVMLPRFLTQLSKDYKAWASGDTSRRPLGTGKI